MKAWKIAALACALLGAVAIGGALAPARAQSEAVIAAAPVEPVETQNVFRFGGSRLGVTVRDVTEDDVKKGRLGGSYGVVIDQVSTESAAEKAGFKSGDIVVEFDGERVRSVQQFTRLVQETPAGRSVSAVVMRDGQKSTLTVQPRDSWPGREDLASFIRSEIPSRIVTPRPTPPRVPVPAPTPEPFLFSFRAGTTIGVSVSDMSDQLAEYFGAKEGALVTSVSENSAAAKAGVKAGDVITAINGEAVKVPSDVRRAAQRLASGSEFTIDVLRDKKKLTLKGKAEERPAARRRIVV